MSGVGWLVHGAGGAGQPALCSSLTALCPLAARRSRCRLMSAPTRQPTAWRQRSGMPLRLFQSLNECGRLNDRPGCDGAPACRPPAITAAALNAPVPGGENSPVSRVHEGVDSVPVDEGSTSRCHNRNPRAVGPLRTSRGGGQRQLRPQLSAASGTTASAAWQGIRRVRRIVAALAGPAVALASPCKEPSPVGRRGRHAARCLGRLQAGCRCVFGPKMWSGARLGRQCGKRSWADLWPGGQAPRRALALRLRPSGVPEGAQEAVNARGSAQRRGISHGAPRKPPGLMHTRALSRPQRTVCTRPTAIPPRQHLQGAGLV